MVRSAAGSRLHNQANLRRTMDKSFAAFSDIIKRADGLAAINVSQVSEA